MLEETYNLRFYSTLSSKESVNAILGPSFEHLNTELQTDEYFQKDNATYHKEH
jgi:hypothetical protein